MGWNLDNHAPSGASLLSSMFSLSMSTSSYACFSLQYLFAISHDGGASLLKACEPLGPSDTLWAECLLAKVRAAALSLASLFLPSNF